MAKKKTDKQQYFIKGKDIITDPNAPIVSDEFIDTTRPEGDYQGATLQVQSDTKLEDDIGTGQVYALRSYQFQTNPELLREVKEGRTKFPTSQEIFDSHMRGIAGMLWQDGLTPEVSIEPRLIFAKDKSSYLILVWARPSYGKVVSEKPKTLTEILNDPRQDTNKLQRSVQLPSAKKEKAS